MKTFFFILLSGVVSSMATPPPPAVSVTTTKLLAWGPSTTPGVKYRLYHSIDDKVWFTNYLTTATNYTVTVQAGSTNWFMVKAVNDDGIESDPSNVFEQPIQPKPNPAGPLLAVPITTSIQTRSILGEWVTVRSYTNNVIVEKEAGREFRAMMEIGKPVELVKLR